jgi:hypothetical protein
MTFMRGQLSVAACPDDHKLMGQFEGIVNIKKKWQNEPN